MSTFAVENFGCRASAADGDAIAELLDGRGLERVAANAAETVVVNTCAVTANAERSARAAIRRLVRERPGVRIVVTGCYAQRAPGELAALPGVAAVVGNSHKARVVDAVAAHLPASVTGLVQIVPAPGQFVREAVANSAETPVEPWHRPFPLAGGWDAGHCDESVLPLATRAGAKTRPVLKVQDGCGNRCSFCVIPETRGPSRSVPMAEVLDAARRFAGTGGQEMVLSGINLGRWGAELEPRRTLAELVRALLEETALPRLRLSSIEPMDWTPELIGLVRRYATGLHPRLAPHAHLPLQSGSDAILRRMHRRYRPWHYRRKVEELRAAMPDAALGADVMVGFPGETDALFAETVRLAEALPLTYLHLFPFSARPRTAAEALHRAAPVPGGVVRGRMGVLRELGEAKWREFAGRFVGREVSAVTLADGTALTGNFLAVAVGMVDAGRMERVRVDGWEWDRLVGVVVE